MALELSAPAVERYKQLQSGNVSFSSADDVREFARALFNRT